MSTPIVEDLPQDADPSTLSPPGWTTRPNLTDPRTVEEMFKDSTGLTATLELAEDEGSRYIFSSDQVFYVWNTASEQGWKIVGETSRDSLYDFVKTGRGLRLEELPDYQNDLEG
ncbi:hypothetical protein BD769DRAFT_1668964 [Suillus cothurnatus]|nr:hypothetical protein BD769DRAFT_1668964 [Suillus cothurnatus]